MPLVNVSLYPEAHLDEAVLDRCAKSEALRLLDLWSGRLRPEQAARLGACRSLVRVGVDVGEDWTAETFVALAQNPALHQIEFSYGQHPAVAEFIERSPDWMYVPRWGLIRGDQRFNVARG